MVIYYYDEFKINGQLGNYIPLYTQFKPAFDQPLFIEARHRT